MTDLPALACSLRRDEKQTSRPSDSARFHPAPRTNAAHLPPIDDFSIQMGMNNAARTKSKWVPGRLYPVISGRFYFTAHADDNFTRQEIQQNPRHFYFSTDLQERYYPFCADFGPVDLAAIVQFADHIQSKFEDSRLRNRPLVYYCATDYESVSNTAMLLSSFLLLQRGFSCEDAFQPFENILDAPIVPFRDPTYHPSTFPITVLDCLRGLNKARELGWFSLSEFDLDEFEDLSSPDSGDISIICPKFVAFRGPEDDIATAEKSGALSPDVYVERFEQLDVDKVVRLNEASTYDKRAFERAGLAHVDLFFDDCTTPPEPLVARFLAEAAGPGRLAVHCLAGLGRTGTLIGVWLMRECGFSAREAIGWLRLVRPGSVIGPQQHYLEWVQARLADGTFLRTQLEGSELPAASAVSGSSVRRGSGLALAKELSTQVRQALSIRKRR